MTIRNSISLLLAATTLANAVPLASVSAQVTDSPASSAAPMDAPVQGLALRGKTNVDRAVGKCVGAVFLGALLGAGLGAIGGNAGDGALIGAGVGVGVCAIIMKVASDRDKREIRNAQLAAFNSAQSINASWTTQEGLNAQATVVPTGSGSVMVAKNGSLQCRSDNQCLVGDNWYSRDAILAGSIDPGAPKLAKASITGAQQLVCRRAATSIAVAGQQAQNSSDVACLIGDSWITGDELKKKKIREADIII